MQNKGQAFGLFTLQDNKLVEMLIDKQEIESFLFFVIQGNLGLLS